MLIVQYVWRALVRSSRRTFTGVVGTLLAIGLLSSVLLFVGASAREMTQRTIADVPVDMRAEALTYQLDIQPVLKKLRQQSGVLDAQPFTLSHFSGSSFARGDTTFKIGPGAIIAVNESYFSTFPVIRIVQGTFGPAGIVISQDMGTNLGAQVGDTISLNLPGTGPDFPVPIIGIADMHKADSLFAPTDPRLAGAAFNPPANVVLLPLSVFDAQLAARLKSAPPPEQPITSGGPTALVQGDVLTVDQQIHLKIDRSALASDPTQAQVQTTRLRRSLEKLYPDQLRVSNDLSAAIEVAKEDVLWAQILFVFLAIPGILLAAYLSRYTAEGLVENQRREFALLRTRGASSKQVLGIVIVMSLVINLIGAALGVLVGVVTTTVFFGPQVFTIANWRLWGSTFGWCILAGVLIALLSTVVPARRLLREEIIGERRSARAVERAPLWARLYVDVVALIAAGIVFQITRANGFHPILNAEGSPTLSLSVYTFLAPLLFWIGSTFFLIRVATVLLQHSSRGLSHFLRPLFGEVSDYAVTTTRRRIRVMSETMIVVALAVSFGVSLSIFANTYAQQQRVDAELTLGSDIKVTPTDGHPQTNTFATTLAQIPGVTAVTPFKTTTAYVGTEIQDIFGIDVPSLRRAAVISDAFFQGDTAAGTLDRLAATPDGILISQEKARDYSIVTGDHVTIRLLNTTNQTYQDVQFTVVGVALEFPTAPSDAFLVVNLPALVRATADSSINIFLLKTAGDPAALAKTVQTQLGSEMVHTQSISTVAAKLATSLTSLNLRGLVDIEYVYTALIASVGLMIFLLALLGERQREFATMRAVGATGRQLATFIVSEVGLISLSGLFAGALIGIGLAVMLVVILTSIFDPPPAAPIPSYPPLLLLIVLNLVGLTAASILALLRLHRMRVNNVLRE